MSKVVVHVPSIRDDDEGYDKLLGLAGFIFANPKRHFDFDFSNCGYIDHNAVVILGGLARYVDNYNTLSDRVTSKLLSTKLFSSAGVMFLVDTMRSLVVKKLVDNNFLSHFSSGGSPYDYPAGDYIGYREHNNALDADKIAEHLQNEWLDAGKLNLSVRLKEAIVSRIFEIFMNAYGHGVLIQNKNNLGVYSCGQYDKKKKALNISVLDFGPGIIANVKKINPDITDSTDAMRWALVRGNSTRTDSKVAEMPRGLGLDLLHEFVRVNDGELRIYSNDVKMVSTKTSGVVVEKSIEHLDGTLVSIKINCDNRYYRFLSESKAAQKQYF